MKYQVKSVLTGEKMAEFEADTLVNTPDGFIIGFNTSTVEPKTQKVIFCSKSDNITVTKIDSQ